VVESSLYLVAALYVGIAVAYAVVQGRLASRHVSTSRPVADRRWPSVDVVLPCYNEDAAVLAHCCAALEHQDYPGELRLFLVDDGSRNRETIEAAVYRRYRHREGWTVILLDGNKGKRIAQDAAVRRGRGELVVTMDSDTSVAPGAIRRLVAAFAGAEVGAVTGDVRVRNLDHNRLTRLIDERYRLLFEQERAAQGVVGSVLCCSGPFSAYRRSALERVWVDYLRQTFAGRTCVAGDDIHLTNLVLAHGYRSLYEPSARALTIVPTTLRGYLLQQARWNRSFYRELLPTLRILPRRSPYLALDVGARLLLPLLLAAGLVLAGVRGIEGAAADPLPTLLGAALAGLMVACSAWLLGGKTTERPTATGSGGRARSRTRPKLGFVLLYGMLYVFLLIPVRFWSLATVLRNGWGTRRVAPNMAVGSIALVGGAAAAPGGRRGRQAGSAS
jgi:cellulose synthase/poly-beta-1,6-N-acetylglucosamine synthase-like glycosyltransferase